MDLQRRLGRQVHSSACLDLHVLRQPVATEDAGRRPGENHPNAVRLEERTTDPERWFGVGVGQHGLPATNGEDELEPGVPPDQPDFPGIDGDRIGRFSDQTAAPARSRR